jgi:hypothetical protein
MVEYVGARSNIQRWPLARGSSFGIGGLGRDGGLGFVIGLLLVHLLILLIIDLVILVLLDGGTGGEGVLGGGCG